MTARSWRRFSPVKGMLTVVASIRREHVEAFVAAELERTAPSSGTTRYRLPQHLFKWLDDERGIISLHSGTQSKPESISDTRFRHICLDGMLG